MRFSSLHTGQSQCACVWFPPFDRLGRATRCVYAMLAGDDLLLTNIRTPEIIIEESGTLWATFSIPLLGETHLKTLRTAARDANEGGERTRRRLTRPETKESTNTSAIRDSASRSDEREKCSLCAGEPGQEFTERRPPSNGFVNYSERKNCR